MKVSREPLHRAGASKGALVAPPHVTYAQCNSIGVAVMLRHRWYSHNATDGATNTAGTAIMPPVVLQTPPVVLQHRRYSHYASFSNTTPVRLPKKRLAQGPLRLCAAGAMSFGTPGLWPLGSPPPCLGQPAVVDIRTLAANTRA